MFGLCYIMNVNKHMLQISDCARVTPSVTAMATVTNQVISVNVMKDLKVKWERNIFTTFVPNIKSSFVFLFRSMFDVRAQGPRRDNRKLFWDSEIKPTTLWLHDLHVGESVAKLCSVKIISIFETNSLYLQLYICMYMNTRSSISSSLMITALTK